MGGGLERGSGLRWHEKVLAGVLSVALIVARCSLLQEKSELEIMQHTWEAGWSGRAVELRSGEPALPLRVRVCK